MGYSKPDIQSGCLKSSRFITVKTSKQATQNSRKGTPILSSSLFENTGVGNSVKFSLDVAESGRDNFIEAGTATSIG